MALDNKVKKKWTTATGGGIACGRTRADQRKSRTCIPLSCLLLVLSSLWLSCSNKAETEPAPTVDVQVAAVERTSIQRKVSADAVIYPLKQASMMPKISAPLTAYLVNRGAHVHAGDVLAQLENKDLAAAATENKGGYEQAQAAYETAIEETLPEEMKKALRHMRNRWQKSYGLVEVG